jgi:hypothetical protein
MRVRWAGVTLALAAVAAGAGYAGGRLAGDQPAAGAAEPVAASSPAYPVNPYEIEPDPGIAPLGTDLPLHPARFAVGDARMTASVPDGWQRAVVRPGNDSWMFTKPGNPANTYLLRIGIVVGDRDSLFAALEHRITQFEDADRNGDLPHFRVEERRDDGFTATYLENGHLRVTLQRWLPVRGTTQAFATVAVTGRDRDRTGLADLLERVVASASY